MNLDYKNRESSFAVDATFGFNDRTIFFRSISCDIPYHSLTFIVGKNGVGKSTFFRVLQGKFNPGEQIQGTVCINGNLLDYADSQTHKLLQSMVYLVDQDYSAMLAPSFSVAVNLGAAQLPRYPFGSLPATYRYFHILEEVGISLHSNVAALSGGQRQMLAIIMALQKPIQFLLLDEPTAALDDDNSKQLMRFIIKLTKQYGITIICVTHDKSLLQMFNEYPCYEIIKNEQGERTFIPKR